MSKSYKPKGTDLYFNGIKVDFAEGTCIDIEPKYKDKVLSKNVTNKTITLTLAEESAKLIQDAIDNTEFVIGYDNERICPLCEGQNDYKIIDSINGHPCEIKTYPSRRKVLWFIFKTFFSLHFRAYSVGRCAFSFNVTDEEGNYQYLSYKEGNNWKELKKEKER